MITTCDLSKTEKKRNEKIDFLFSSYKNEQTQNTIFSSHHTKTFVERLLTYVERLRSFMTRYESLVLFRRKYIDAEKKGEHHQQCVKKKKCAYGHSPSMRD